MQRKYPLVQFLNDIIALYRWKLPKRDALMNLFQKKRSILKAGELEMFNQSIGVETRQTIFFLFIACLFMIYSFLDFLSADSMLYGLFNLSYATIAFFIGKAHYKRAYELLKN